MTLAPIPASHDEAPQRAGFLWNLPARLPMARQACTKEAEADPDRLVSIKGQVAPSNDSEADGALAEASRDGARVPSSAHSYPRRLRMMVEVRG